MKLFLPLFFLLFSFASFGQRAFPTPSLTDVDQQSVELADRIGQGDITVVAIWATWCQPCHMELDEMKAHVDDWAETYGAEVLAISVDKRHQVSRIKPLVARKGWEYDILVDSNGRLAAELGFKSIPQMYILNGEGKIIKSFSGFASGRMEQVERALSKLAK